MLRKGRRWPVIPLLHHEQVAPHVRFSGAFSIDPSNRMETRLLDFRILADCHPLVHVEIPSRGSSGSPQMAQVKSIYTTVGVTP